MKLLDAFAGIGGFSYAAERLVGGFETKQFIEIDEYCQSVLRKNFPNTPIHDDIRTFKAEQGEYDVLSAGFPCQDLSVAGSQKGIGEGTRSGLFYEVVRLIRDIRPKFVLLENVRNLLSHQGGETFQEVLFQIAKAGYDAEWSVVSAADMGACHKRERIWIIAYPNKSEGWQRGVFKDISNEGWGTSEDRRESIQSEDGETCTNNFRQSSRVITNSESTGTRIDQPRLRRQSERRCMQTDRNTNKETSSITNSDNDGSSTSTRLRFNVETDSSSQKRENQISESKGSSESRGSGTVQQITETSDTNGERLEGEVGTRIPRSVRWETTPTSRRLNPNWSEYASEPVLRRGDDGLSNRIPRIKALGNSIVPACAAVPLQRIKYLNDLEERT